MHLVQILLILPWIIAGLFAVLFITTVFLEKGYLRDLVPDPSGQSETDSPYFKAMNEAAQRHEFRPAGIFNQSRPSKIYRARAALWVSPDGHVLARVGGGTTANVPIKRTILVTVVEPDRIVQTQDDFATADLSGLTDRKVLMNADWEELLACHNGRLASYPGDKRTFSPNSALADWESIQAMKAGKNARLGLIRFLNGDRTLWRNTPKGAWLQYYNGFRGQLAESKTQKDRVSKKRPDAS